MTKTALINGIRLDIQKEEEAIRLYDGQVALTRDKRAKKVLSSISKEEKVHIGELTKLLELLDGECKYMKEGMEEASGIMGEKPRKGHEGHRRHHRHGSMSLGRMK